MSTIEINWDDVGAIEDVPARGARVVTTPFGDVAVFKAADGTLFALRDSCPHMGGPLSQGIVHGHSVTCPLHNWVICLDSGEAAAPDKGCTAHIPLRIENGRILLQIGVLAPARAA